MLRTAFNLIIWPFFIILSFLLSPLKLFRKKTKADIEILEDVIAEKCDIPEGPQNGLTEIEQIAELINQEDECQFLPECRMKISLASSPINIPYRDNGIVRKKCKPIVLVDPFNAKDLDNPRARIKYTKAHRVARVLHQGGGVFQSLIVGPIDNTKEAKNYVKSVEAEVSKTTKKELENKAAKLREAELELNRAKQQYAKQCNEQQTLKSHLSKMKNDGTI